VAELYFCLRLAELNLQGVGDSVQAMNAERFNRDNCIHWPI